MDSRADTKNIIYFAMVMAIIVFVGSIYVLQEPQKFQREGKDFLSDKTTQQLKAHIYLTQLLQQDLEGKKMAEWLAMDLSLAEQTKLQDHIEKMFAQSEPIKLTVRPQALQNEKVFVSKAVSGSKTLVKTSTELKPYGMETEYILEVYFG